MSSFAKPVGIHSVAAAIVFAVFYAPLFGWFVWQSFKRPAYVSIILAFFCLIRIVGFGIRARLAGIEAAGDNLSLYIADQVFFGVGFFALLDSAYTLVHDRWQLVNGSGSLRLTQERQVIRIILLAALALGIVGASKTSKTDPENGEVYLATSTILFLTFTISLALSTLVLIRLQAKTSFRTLGSRTLGGEHGLYLLCVINLLLIVREAFNIATIINTVKFNNEHFWYPLYALPEILAVIVYSTPGLVPPRSELPN